MGEQVHVFLNDEHDVSAQRGLQQLPRAISVSGRALRDLNERRRGFGRQEWCLQQWLLDLPQVGLPELQVTSGDEGCSDGVVKDILDAKLVEDARLVIRDSELFGYLSSALWRQNISRFNGSVRNRSRRYGNITCAHLEAAFVQSVSRSRVSTLIMVGELD